MPGPSRAHALARFAQAVADQNDTGRLRFTVATVSAIAAGAGTDGGDVVTVTVGSDDIDAPHLASYSSPTVGHLVWVVLVDGSPAILGRFVGLPNF
jgi:hypothetical protein